jgi:hypothetical protein
MKFEVKGVQPLVDKLKELSMADYDQVCEDTAVSIRNRGIKSHIPSQGGTPISTEKTRPHGQHGELRESMMAIGNEVGYTKDYAPHVEYGHRVCRPAGNQIGYVEGKNFLATNVELEKPLFKERIKEMLKSMVE